MPENHRDGPCIWDAAPLAIVLGHFLLITAINADYELKIFHPVPINGHLNYSYGPLIFIAGLALAAVSCVFHYLFRQHWTDREWVGIIGSGLICLVCLALGLLCIVLGPALLTMMEQMSNP